MQALVECEHPRCFRAIAAVATRPVIMLDAVRTLRRLRSPVPEAAGLSVNASAKALAVSATCIHEVAGELRGITADAAERLARRVGGGAASWLAMPADYEPKTLPGRAEIVRKAAPREASMA